LGDLIKGNDVCVGYVGVSWETESIKIFGGATYRRRPLGRSSLKGEYKIILGFKGIEWGEANWTKLTQDRDRRHGV
jgi:hypothetical protein